MISSRMCLHLLCDKIELKVVFYMNLIYRMIQSTLKLFSKLLPWREPILYQGLDDLSNLKSLMLKSGIQKWLIVTDQGLYDAGLVDQLVMDLAQDQIYLYASMHVTQNPTIDQIELLYQDYIEFKCEGIIGFGGGSPIDAAKGLGVKVKYPKHNVSKFKGLLKIHRKLPMIIAIPTTAGTGSEATLAAVLSDPKNKKKYALMDIHLIPAVAWLNPSYLAFLPSFYTATTGMDALTHAIEAYVSLGRTKKTDQRALSAIKTIFDKLILSYEHPRDVSLREDLLIASYDAGFAFTRAYVGNIHAIAHTFGAFYDIPHGYANAIIMPYVLSYSFDYVKYKLKEIYDYIHPDRTLKTDEKANWIIQHILDMNQKMNIPRHIEIPHLNHLNDMVSHAFKEANPIYPVRHIYQRKDYKTLIETVSKIKDAN